MHYSEYLSIFLQNSLPPYLYLRKSVLLVLKTGVLFLLQFLRKKFEIFLVVGGRKKSLYRLIQASYNKLVLITVLQSARQ